MSACFSAASRSLCARCLVASCSPLLIVRLITYPPTASTTGIISSCIQSQRVLPGWYSSVLMTVPAFVPLMVCAIVTLLYPLKPVQSNQYPTIINAMTTTSTIPTTPIATRCCFICCHHERNLARIVLLLLHDG